MQMHDDQRAAAQNIETIVRLEEEDETRVSRSDRISESIGSFAGTMGFVTLQIVIVLAWIGINTGVVPGAPVFDPYPFGLLSVGLSLEGVLLMSFILVRQSRMSNRADRRSHLALQINLLSERETTKVLQMLQDISAHLGLDASDAEIEELSKETAIENLGRNLRATLEKDAQCDKGEPDRE